MKVNYGIYSFDTNSYLFTSQRGLKEKHLFKIEYGVFFPTISDRDNT